MSRLLAALSISLAVVLPGVAAADTFSQAVAEPAVAQKVAALADGLDADEKRWVTWVVGNGGVEGPGKEVSIGGEPWMLYGTCRIHMCDEQAIDMLVGPSGDVFLKLSGTAVAGGAKVLGDAPAAARSALMAR